MKKKLKIIGLTLFRISGIYIVYLFAKSIVGLWVTVAMSRSIVGVMETKGDTVKSVIRTDYSAEEYKDILPSLDAAYDFFVSTLLDLHETALEMFRVAGYALLGYLFIEFVLFLFRAIKKEKALKALRMSKGDYSI